MKNTKHICLIFLWLVAMACRKNVDLNLPAYKQKIVVEASIETGQPAFVVLSNSIPYFGNFDLSQPQNAYINNATIILSDGTLYDTLKPLVIPQVPTPFYIGSKVFGQVGKTYGLKIIIGTNTFEASSEILNPVKLDSLFFKGEKDTLGFMWNKFSEPKGEGDCYRWMAKRASRDLFYAAPFNSVFNDKFVDGKTFEFAYDRGIQPYVVTNSDKERGYYKRGDTVMVKFSHIGQAEYEFWRTYYQNKVSNSNPFSAPSNIKGNIGNPMEVLGAFCAYSTSYDTLVIPKK